MKKTICIKGVSEEDWRYFKSEAVRKGKTMGEFFGVLIDSNRHGRDKPRTG